MKTRLFSFTCAAMLLGALAGCAPVPKPAALSQADEVSRGAFAEEAKSLAPQAFAHAEKLRREARAAFDAGDLAGAQLVAERAIAAYAHAGAFARIARADETAGEARKQVVALEPEAASLQAEQLRAGAEADALELRAKVARDAQSVVPSAPADPGRERARLAAARALALQARLLCGAAKLLAAGSAGLSAPLPGTPSPGVVDPAVELDLASAEAAKLDEELSALHGSVPIDHATRARARCLAALTLLRRAGTPVTKAPGAGDALLTELSAAGTWSPSRDDRGVVVTLRGGWRGASLTQDGEARVAALGRVAAAHPSFPVEVVLHADKEPSAKDEAESRERAAALVKVLRGGNDVRVEVVFAGARAPVVDPRGRDRGRNARIEVVFVTPEVF